MNNFISTGRNLHFSSDRTKETYKFRCSDTGRGMSKDFISHVLNHLHKRIPVQEPAIWVRDSEWRLLNSLQK